MPDAAETSASAATEGTGKNTGAGDGAGTQPAAGNEATTAAPVFSTEQIAHIGNLLKEEREKEREAARKANERAQAKEQERVAEEQGKFKEVAEQRAARIAELEAENARVARQSLITKVAARHKLPDEIAELLKGDTEAELEAHAKKLAAMLVPPKASSTETGPNNRTTTTVGGDRPNPQPAGGSTAATNTAKPYRFQTPGDVPWN
jgi:hypothetical protein